MNPMYMPANLQPGINVGENYVTIQIP
jgi:hypothetical protein